MIRMLEPIEAFIGYANQLIRLLTILWEGGHSMVHTHADA
jgi:hypothetical protein